MKKEWVHEDHPEYQRALSEVRTLEVRHGEDVRAFGNTILTDWTSAKKNIAACTEALRRVPVQKYGMKGYRVEMVSGPPLFLSREAVQSTILEIQNGMEVETRHLFAQFGQDIAARLSAKEGLDVAYTYEEMTNFFWSNGQIASAIQEIVPGSKPDNPHEMQEYCYAFAHKVVEGGVPLQLLQQLLEEHGARFEKDRQECEKVVTDIVDEFKADVAKAVLQGKFPEHVLSELSRIDVTRHIALTDVLVEKIDNVYMSVRAQSRTMKMAPYFKDPILRPFLKLNLYHELAHVISGKDFLLHKNWLGIKEIDNHRIGFARNGRGTWLNEATTERIAEQLHGDVADATRALQAWRAKMLPAQDHSRVVAGTYPHEMHKLEDLIVKGVNERLVYDAYFEHFAEAHSPLERGVAYKKLLQKVREVAGPNMLLQIENEFTLYKVAQSLFEALPGVTLRGDRAQGDKYVLPVELSVGVQSTRVATVMYISTRTKKEFDRLPGRLKKFSGNLQDNGYRTVSLQPRAAEVQSVSRSAA